MNPHRPTVSMGFASTLSGIVMLTLMMGEAVAQLVPDDSLGAENSTLVEGAIEGLPATLIEGGATRESNLFHSFLEFNVGDGQAVYFANPAGILNIFSRVTGDDPSNIFGTLGVDGYANLLFINPNGIAFGPNARLDIPASFTASTADSITFDDGQLFSAVNPNEPPILQISIMPGLQYGPRETEITNQGSLETGQNLTLGAYRLDLAGDLEAGRDIILQGQERFLSEADYTVGGYFFTQDLTGAGIDILIPHENVIIAEGDVIFEENYAGPSLYVLAGGQVTQSDNSTDLIITEASFSSITETIPNGIGENQDITLETTNQATTDIRSGLNLSKLSNHQLGNMNSSNATVTLSEATGLSLILENVINFEGAVVLQSGDNLQMDVIDTFSGTEDLFPVTGTDGGSIFAQAAEDVAINFLSTATQASSTFDAVGGRAGTISVFAGRDLDLDSFEAFTNTVTEVGNSLGGDGGTVTLAAGRDLTVAETSFTIARNASTFGSVAGGNAGDIVLLAGRDLESAELGAFALSLSNADEPAVGLGGRGGDIFVSAGRDATVALMNAASQTDAFDNSPQGQGFVVAVGGQGGNINAIADRNLTVGIVTASSRANAVSFSAIGLAEGGTSGNLTLTAGQDLSLNSAFTTAFTFAFVGDVIGSDAGDITLTAGNDVITNNMFADSQSSSHSGDNVLGGHGGEIVIDAGRDILTQDIDTLTNAVSLLLTAFATGEGNALGGSGGAIQFTAGRDVETGKLLTLSSTSSSTANSISGDGAPISLIAGRHVQFDELTSLANARIRPGVNNEPLLLPSTVIESGRGGDIQVTANTGSITGQLPTSDEPNLASIITVSIGQEGTANSAGNVLLQAADNIQDLEIITLSSSDRSGDIQFRSPMDLTFDNVNVVTSKQIEVEVEFLGRILIEAGGDGQSGNVEIVGDGNLEFFNSAFLSDTNGSDPAGDLTITSPNWVILDNTSFNSDTQSIGQAGSLTISAGEGLFISGSDSQLLARSSAIGSAGNISLTTPQLQLTDNATISTATSGLGRAGNIVVNTETTHLLNGGSILALTSGIGNGGTISVNADRAVQLGEETQAFEPIISVEASGAGQPGNININTPNFMLSETARITATATATAMNQGGGGSITLSADQMNLTGTIGIFAETEGAAPGGVLTLQPYQGNANLDVTLAPGSVVSASTSGTGRGGDLRVVAPHSVTLSGPGLLAAETSGLGPGGNIDITAQQLNLLDGITVSASTRGVGTAGNVTLAANELSIQNGARVEAATEPNSTGNGGSIGITANQVNLTDGQIAVTSAGTGRGGDITLVSDRATLTRSQIIAETLSSDGGELNLTFNDLLLLRDRSLISTTAGTAQAGGNGGNITINNANGFIIAFPTENSDITANAFEGNGGNIAITTRGLFGIEFREALTPLSDITASSGFGLSGTVSLDGPDTGAIENNLSDFDESIVDTAALTAGSCIARTDDATGSFVVTGGEGLPHRPGGDNISVYPTGIVQTVPETAATNTLQEPQSVYRLADGRLVLSHECD